MKPLKLIIIILIIGLGVTGFFLYKKYMSPNKTIVKEICQSCQGKNNPFGFAGPYKPDNFDWIKKLGIKYIRESISWNTIEPSKNRFNFDPINISNFQDKYGFDIIVRLKFGQIWATKCDKSLTCSNDQSSTCPSKNADCPPKDLGNWSDKGYSPLLYDFTYKPLENAKKNGQKFKYIIVGNEASSMYFWHGTSDDYLKTRATIYKAVKDVNEKYNSTYQVVDNGIASTIWGGAILRENYCTNDQKKKEFAMEYAKKYFSRIYDGPYTEDALAKRINCDNPSRDYLFIKEIFKRDPNLEEASFDIMSYHFYEPWNTQEDVINWIKTEMKNNGYSKPIMNTEGGYHDTLHLYSNTPSLKKDVANEIPKLHLVALANGVQAWLWLPFTERTGGLYGLEWKGLVSEKQEILPAYFSYQIMVAKLAGFAAIEKLDKFGDAYVYKVSFSDKNPLYVIWSNENTQIDISSIIKGEIVVTNVDQTTKNLTDSKIDIGPSPIYIESISSNPTSKDSAANGSGLSRDSVPRGSGLGNVDSPLLPNGRGL